MEPESRRDNAHDQKVAMAAEVALRRYEARLGFWKVVLGTMIVGLAGVLIPSSVTIYSERVENVRKAAEFKLAQQAAHQEYIKDFIATAINQDIELRIRFADYFAELSGPDQHPLWKSYRDSLVKLRKEKREEINTLEKKLVDLKKQELEGRSFDNAEFGRTNRELEWAHKEVEYAPTERSVVASVKDTSPIVRKMRLYPETLDVVQRLASKTGPLPERDLARFWKLYWNELIGVESREFGRTMTAIGQELKLHSDGRSSDSANLNALADRLASISQLELAEISTLNPVEQARQQLQQLQQLQQQLQQVQQQQQQLQQQQQQLQLQLQQQQQQLLQQQQQQEPQ